MRGALVGAIVGVLAASPARALHKESPPAYRITSGASHFHPQTRSWANYFAFTSSEDLAGNGNTTQQIFYFNMAFFDCFMGTTFPTTPCPNPLVPFVRQLTNGPGAPDNPSLGQPFATGGTLTNNDLSCIPTPPPPCFGTGCPPPPPCRVVQWLAFDAPGSYNGGTGAPAAHRQIFEKNIISGEIRQATFGTDGDSVRPVVSSLGGIVAFESTAHLTFGALPAGVKQIYVYENNTGLVKPLTAGAVPSANATIDQNGGIIAWQSAADLLHDGHDTGVQQIFYAEYDKRAHTAVLHQLTNGDGPSQHPFLSESSTFATFESTATNLPGTLGGGGSNIYMSTPLAATSPQPPALAQITDSAHFGDCFSPSVDAGTVADHIGFICTGDPLMNGTTGNRVFIFERSSLTLFQITGRGDVQPPIGMSLGSWFLTLATTSDLTNQGTCGYQLYVVDYLGGIQAGHDIKWQAATQPGQLPPDAIGPPRSNIIGVRTLSVLPFAGQVGGDTGGDSEVTITTAAGAASGGFPKGGTIRLVIGAPDQFTGEASIDVNARNSMLPPVTVPGFGTVCLKVIADGTGTLDCDGGKAGGDVNVSQDHTTDDTNPLCLAPDCRENDPSCKQGLFGPHRTLCPICATTGPGTNATCIGGVFAGQPCTSDAACQGSMDCVNGTVATCNGAISTALTGTYAVGGMELTIPVSISLSNDPGTDGVFCTRDDIYSPVRDITANLRLTTGSGPGTITDVDDVAAATLSTTAAGVPFDCNRVRAGDLGGSVLVGVLPILDVPSVPTLHDLLVNFLIEAAPPTTTACNSDPPCLTSADCNDGNPCNGVETCVNNACAPGAPVVCDDGNPCTTDTCNPTDGTCTFTPCNDGNPCNGVETCDVAGCHPGTPVVCDDGNACNGVETCNTANGTCLPGTPLVCDDMNPCTTDTCDMTAGCVFTPVANGTVCDAGLCVLGATCTGGACVGTPVACSDGDACNGIETCNTADGTCLPGTPPNCDDSNVCTDDSCDMTLGCVHTDNTLPCDDMNPCTTGDVCALGTCVGVPISCVDADLCNGTETCDTTTGLCVPGTPLNCDDQNPCTTDSCDMLLGCQHVPLFDGTTCDDGNACTAGDTCLAGLCVGVPTPCNDGDACNGVETCDTTTGVCSPGTPVNCDDGNACTLDVCNSVDGTCTHVLVPDGILCLLDVLTAQVTDASPSAFGGADRQARLRLRLVRVRSRVVRAMAGQHAMRNYRRADRSLIRFKRVLQRGMNSRGFDPLVSSQLIDLDNQVIGGILAQIAAIRG